MGHSRTRKGIVISDHLIRERLFDRSWEGGFGILLATSYVFLSFAQQVIFFKNNLQQFFLKK